MLKRVYRYDVKGRKYIGTPYKIYFEDVGLRNARLNFRQIEPTHLMDSFKKIIIVKDRVKPFLDEHGILTINLFDFLLDRDSLDL